MESSFSPREIVSELDKFIIGQKKAKKAVAVALRNRWRSKQLEKDLKPFKVASVTPVVIDPVTTNLILQITFQYNSNATTKTREALESLVSTTVKNYNNTKLKFIDISGDFILVN